MAYNKEKYAKKVAAGGLTRREEINRAAYAKALLGDPEVTWKQAKSELTKSELVVLNQMAKMKQADKEKWASFNKNDYTKASRKWEALERKNPGRKEEIHQNKLLMQLKMCFSKDMLSDQQKQEIRDLLADILEPGEDFGSYWGY